jgi:3-oxoacyl-[acyl-carrier protein] reductase
MKNLKGKVALVTGASRGLGRGIALALAENGADIVINFRSSQEEAETLKQQIEEMGQKALLAKADISKKEDVQKLFELVSKEFGQLDILVNNAGTTKAQDIFETSLEDWDFIIKTNLTSVFLCSKAALEMMKNQGSGRIINISSIVGHRGALYGHVHYAATKSGMFGFTKTLARTAAPFGVTVNCIAPGIIGTELLYQTHGEEDVEKLAASVPLGLGNVQDVGLAAAYLAGDGGRYITGSTIDVNGGMYLR